MDKINWGVIGPAGIANRFATDVIQLEGANAYAVASRTKKRADDFAEKYGFDKSYGSYDDIITDPDVDIIYIGVPHPFHMDIAIKCMQAGKSVLCEKPFAVNYEQGKRMVDCARENNVFFMEAMWTRFQPVNSEVYKLIQSGKMGKPRYLQADFSFRFGNWLEKLDDTSHRLVNPNLAGGGILDVGVYVVSLAQAVMGKEPTEIRSLVTKIETGVDGMMTCILQYDDGEMASLQCGVIQNTDQNAYIYMDEGKITINEFWHAAKADVHYNDEDIKDTVIEDDFVANGYSGFRYQIEHTMECMHNGLIESPILTHKNMLDTMKVLDTIRKENGVIYPFE